MQEVQLGAKENTDPWEFTEATGKASDFHKVQN